ncbi:hypothetical protein [Lacihabitans sp. LS3-19]|uniref:hypothetical protein n=1 Tax=Lacihabitans sp. LS3-19 TaxID=2487335 RepID=UPI0020CB9FDA|nr:hypothetical protein [Lacihabitans sp. LS3-19]
MDDGDICRYDGRSLTCFTSKDGLVNEAVWPILEDRNGNLWEGTSETGLYLFDGKTLIEISE